MTDLPIVDAHQHFWDLARKYLPWLCDPEPIPFRRVKPPKPWEADINGPNC